MQCTEYTDITAFDMTSFLKLSEAGASHVANYNNGLFKDGCLVLVNGEKSVSVKNGCEDSGDPLPTTDADGNALPEIPPSATACEKMKVALKTSFDEGIPQGGVCTDASDCRSNHGCAGGFCCNADADLSGDAPSCTSCATDTGGCNGCVDADEVPCKRACPPESLSSGTCIAQDENGEFIDFDYATRVATSTCLSLDGFYVPLGSCMPAPPATAGDPVTSTLAPDPVTVDSSGNSVIAVNTTSASASTAAAPFLVAIIVGVGILSF